jgi:hypothetical protein
MTFKFLEKSNIFHLFSCTLDHCLLKIRFLNRQIIINHSQNQKKHEHNCTHVKKKKLFASLIIFIPLQFFFLVLFICSFLACRKLTKSSGTLIKNCLIHRSMNMSCCKCSMILQEFFNI